MNNVKIVPVRAKNISLCVKLYSFFLSPKGHD